MNTPIARLLPALFLGCSAGTAESADAPDPLADASVAWIDATAHAKDDAPPAHVDRDASHAADEGARPPASRDAALDGVSKSRDVAIGNPPPGDASHGCPMPCAAGATCDMTRRMCVCDFGSVGDGVKGCASAKPDSGSCSDGNLAQDDACYLSLVSFDDAAQRKDIESILSGKFDKALALRWLDENFASSQEFVTDTLSTTIHPNYTKAHSSAQPMRGMIVHYTANQREDPTIRYFVGSSPHASTHFIVGSVRNGLVVQIFSHRNRSWHAGSTYNIDRFGVDFANAGYLIRQSDGSYEDYAGRAYTIKLPLFGNSPVTVKGGIPGADAKYAKRETWQPYTYHQLVSFVLLGRALHAAYGLDEDAIERHGDVSDSRVDPGPHLPLTWLRRLVLSKESISTVSWLSEWKVEKDWISTHAAAR